ncbi:OmpA family protein [Steroidobacter sp.]|uniref:OmpA family protein n=1 Tax=Steroidobacter sp. TaxID=1978227 RepID=UPI001A3B5AB9|nr:OmpA family protein [Steroidobacter sp.]MBL8269010.1 OmpA family protein [Steroidobacter sp.]
MLLALWAFFWPVADCDQPGCAKRRFTVGLEIDALGPVQPIEFDVSTDAESVSLQSILKGGGIELVPVIDELGLAYDPASGPLDAADLFQFVSAWRNRGPIEGTDATLYALFVDALIADNGDNLFGIMFDVADREGFAVAPRTTERFFAEQEPSFIATLQLRTFAHELLHALNRHHFDAAQLGDGRLTLEAPTRCIAEAQGRQWRLTETPLMALSPNTIRFFQSAAARDVLPGRENSPFTNRRASPTECDDARTHVVKTDEGTRWSIAMRRLRALIGISMAQAAEAEEEPKESTAAATITLQAQRAAYPLGYPIAVRVIARNTGDAPLPVVERLNPRYGMLQIEYRTAGSDDWQTLQPIAWLEPTSDEDAQLEPGAQTEETVPVYFGEDGWTFAEPGDYEIRARLQTNASGSGAISEPVKIAIASPATPDDQAALQPLVDAQGKLDRDIGRLLYFGGRIGDQDDIAPLEQAAERYGHTAVGAALRLTLLSHRLRKPIDPKTGRRPLPNFEEARELLEDTCTDSGVAAMTSYLLRQRPDTIPSSLVKRSASDAAAWDGVNRKGAAALTYADETLQRRGPSLHFCFNEDSLRKPVATATANLARQLRRNRPERIVVVGHSDAVGTCRYNDSLALRRAQAVKDALVRSGLRANTIDIASLGERRPLDFSWTSSAQNRNRRVEILVRGGPEIEAVAEVAPRCPATPLKPPASSAGR